MSLQQRSLALGVVVSLAAHGLLAVLLAKGQPGEPSQPDRANDLVMVDIEVPPEAKQAHAPKDDGSSKPSPPDPADNGSTIEPPQPADPDTVAVAIIADAGVPDARKAIARRKKRRRLDAMPARDAGSAVATAPESDGGVAVATSAGATDAGVGGGDGGVGAGATASGPPALPGANANLFAFMPAGVVVTVLIRWDRLRPTEWAKRGEAIISSMPDYQMMMGNRRMRIAKRFDSMVIATPDPRAVTLTTVVAHSRRKTNAQVRAFLDHAGAPVSWSVARGGALGTRKPSKLSHPGDKRVYLMPYPGWVVLSRPKNFGKLVEPGAGDIDAAAANPTELPGWLSKLRNIEAVSGRGTGASIVFTFSGFRKKQIEAPVLGSLPAPQRLTLALEVAAKGFYVRGEMIFSTEKRAEDFVAAIKRFQETFVDSSLGKRLLDKVKAYNATKLLSVRRGGRKVGYSTSISISDGRNMMKIAAQQTRQFYANKRQQAEREDSGPAAPKTPAPKVTKPPDPKVPAPKTTKPPAPGTTKPPARGSGASK